MPRLLAPTPELADSFRTAMADFAAEGRGRDGDDSAIGFELRAFGGRWHTDEGLAEFIEHTRRAADPQLPPPPGWVHMSTYWWAEDTRYLGSIRVRHNLGAPGLQVGGHIGYDVAPAARRQGHGRAMLAAMLPIAASLGIESALISCDQDNVGSRRIIEANGGVIEDHREGKLRFWVPTGRQG